MFYFQQLPHQIFMDIVSGELISADMHFYYYLLSKGGHGEPFMLTEKTMAKDLKVSVSKVQGAIKRLREKGHISRRKTSAGFQTTILTRTKRKSAQPQ